MKTLIILLLSSFILVGCSLPKYNIDWPKSENPWNGGDSGDGNSV